MKLLINGVSSYAPGHPIGPARWEHHDLIVVLEGSLDLESAGQHYSLLASDALLVPPDHHFVGAMGAGGGTIWVQHFSAARTELPRSLSAARSNLLLRGAAASEIAPVLLRRIFLLREENDSDAVALRLALFATLLWELERHVKASPALSAANDTAQIQQAIRWAEENIGQAKSLVDVARKAEISESHFRSVFRRLRGQTAGDWLRQCRMAEARRLLSSTALTLKAISNEVGFSDAVSFNRSFNKFHGVPPGAYRRRNPRAV